MQVEKMHIAAQKGKHILSRYKILFSANLLLNVCINLCARNINILWKKQIQSKFLPPKVQIQEKATCLRTWERRNPDNYISCVVPTLLSLSRDLLQLSNIVCIIEMEDSSSPEEGMPAFLSAVRTQAPVVTVPVDEELPDSQVYSSVKACERDQQSFGFPAVNLYDKSKVLRPEDRVCETFVLKKCAGERQGVLPQSAFPNVSEQKRQSKWQKYQNTTQCDLRTQNSSEMAMTDDFQAECVLGMPLDDLGESRSDAINESPPDFVHLQMIKSMLCKQQRNFSSQDSVSEEKKLSLHLSQIFSTEEAPKVLGQRNCLSTTRHAKVCNYSQKFSE